MVFETYGPYVVPKKKTATGGYVLSLDKNSLASFWKKVNKDKDRLSKGRGCYVFGVRAGRGIRPWYVGQSRRPFDKECFASDKQNTYQDVMTRIKTGNAVLFLVAKVGPISRSLSQSLPTKEADFVERLLMQLAYFQNGELENIQGLAFMRKIQIQGILNNPPGQPGKPSKALRTALGALPPPKSP